MPLERGDTVRILLCGVAAMAPPLGETSGVSCRPATKQGGGKKRLEIKKWSAVALWGWGESL